MRLRSRPLGLRRRVVVTIAAGSLVVSATLAAATFVIAREYLVDQRERTAARTAYAAADVVRQSLLTPGRPVADAISDPAAPVGADVLLVVGGDVYTSAIAIGLDDVPVGVREAADRGQVASAWTRTVDGPTVVVGVPIPAVSAVLYEIEPAVELTNTLDTLRRVLVGVALATAVAGAALGFSLSRRVVAPLDDIGAAAARIAGGDLTTRLRPTDDPELATLVGSFNAMLDVLAERIERDARFAADVSHELRSPLTTLVAAVEVLAGRSDELPERSRRALGLVESELARFRQSLEDLLALARLDAAPPEESRSATARPRTDLGELVRLSVEGSGRDPSIVREELREELREEPGAHGGAVVRCDRRQVQRALVNLADNADVHGGGLRAVTVRTEDGWAVVEVDDAGPGVPEQERERIFERFARGGSRGNHSGTGLGLSLVEETVRRHGGTVWCTTAPGGGARFVVRLPLVEEEDR